MKMISPLAKRRGRLEIIPLIDIMFFLLAAFMVVSINKIRVKSLKINLPTNVSVAQLEKKEDFLSLSVNAEGQVQIDKELIAKKEDLLLRLQQLYAQNKEQKFLIGADQDTRYGDVIAALGQVRAAGFQHVGLSLKGDKNGATPTSATSNLNAPIQPVLTQPNPAPLSTPATTPTPATVTP